MTRGRDKACSQSTLSVSFCLSISAHIFLSLVQSFSHAQECAEVLCVRADIDTVKRDRWNRTPLDVATPDCKEILLNRGRRQREREEERGGKGGGGWGEKDREINQFLYLYHTQETSVPMSKHSPPFGSLANSLSLDVPIRHIILTKWPAQTADLIIGVINKRLHHDLIMRVSTSVSLKITHANVVRFYITRCSISHALTQIFCLKVIMPCYWIIKYYGVCLLCWLVGNHLNEISTSSQSLINN